MKLQNKRETPIQEVTEDCSNWTTVKRNYEIEKGNNLHHEIASK